MTAFELKSLSADFGTEPDAVRPAGRVCRREFSPLGRK